MTDERKGSPWIAWCSGIIVVLLGLYVGAYAVAIEERLVNHIHGYRGSGAAIISVIEPAYRIVPNEFGVNFFSPLHAIDRKLRREKWGAPYMRGRP